MAVDLIAWLLEATLAGSAAILAVLLLRRWLLPAFGASAAYAAWMLVPAALLATLLPAAIAPSAPAVLGIPAETAAGLSATVVVRPFDAAPWLATAWMLGLVATVLSLARQQRRFLRGLGALSRRDDGMYQSEAVAGLPAVIGWRSRIVLPRDFEQRYEAHEQQLVLCHENVHRRRGDLPASAFAAVLRCLFWFNPLVHWAARRFRQDQELACDAAVLRRFPLSRRSYGDALFKAQLADQPLPFGCHWFGSHPLKERIAMLKHPLPDKRRWFAGFTVVIALTVAGGWTAWAAQPARVAAPAEAGAPAQDGLATTFKVRFDDGPWRAESLRMHAGQPRTFDYEQDGSAWSIALTVDTLKDGNIFVSADILRDGVSQAQPRLITKPGAAAVIRVGDGYPDRFVGIAIEVLVDAPSAEAVEAAPAKVSAADPLKPWQMSVARWNGAAPPASETEC
ncbi:M56 family metallopeptidase [Arenimonas daejeonensis]|uniref:M56 family metallopeptidase n=1 Tax=Arenimonas daejeonensis TaxID=370777 RepID=UPI0011BD7673|nr:M56 family metallopeptidase [Arenimonas daejeonensis]